MVIAIRVYELGGPEVLKWEDVKIGDPKEGEIRVKNKAIGVNFIVIYFRTGVYKVPEIPYTLGTEAVGVVIAIRAGMCDLTIGDVVYHLGSATGTYAEEQIVLADKEMPLPPIDPLVVASAMVKGLNARFIVRTWFKNIHSQPKVTEELESQTQELSEEDTTPNDVEASSRSNSYVEQGHKVVVNTAVGGVWSLLCQWENMLGAIVIGTVSTKEKALQAKEDGCHHVILYKEKDLVTRVVEITSEEGVDVVFDSVGKDTFQGSLACLKHRGYMVSYGQSSGTPDPVSLSSLATESLFLTRPSVRTSAFSKDEMHEAMKEVLANVASGTLRVRVNHIYPLSQATQAHADMAGRKTSGSIVLIPDGVEQ
ncbi:hypothetical protein SSX86_002079 [Deinandra increscens subsp. villosa]|uniref:Probable quinone oxidoreductase n=1 Tax=Deinandra increscens subsp. villosa TaxID=3103831 RepID=A0AAP0DS73_9ASTR